MFASSIRPIGCVVHYKASETSHYLVVFTTNIQQTHIANQQRPIGVLGSNQLYWRIPLFASAKYRVVIIPGCECVGVRMCVCVRSCETSIIGCANIKSRSVA